MRHLDECPSPARRAQTLCRNTWCRSEELLAFTFILPTYCCSAYEQAIIQSLWFEAVVFEKNSIFVFLPLLATRDSMFIYRKKKLFWSCLTKYLNLSSVGTHNWQHSFYQRSWIWNFVKRTHCCGGYVKWRTWLHSKILREHSVPQVTHPLGIRKLHNLSLQSIL